MTNTYDDHDEKSESPAIRPERLRAVSIAEGTFGCHRLTSYVEDFEFTCHGIRGRYSGEINEVGKPHGNGSFVREKGGMTYIGEWRDGERIGNGGHYTNGRLLGNVVWE
mmetsp:Transcript_11450/g.23439  ORF Transcript_11450/g.23439 Transcript_11450/m.23439 type:complete len:109 (-) Transcript_11450:135-461(-)